MSALVVPLKFACRSRGQYGLNFPASAYVDSGVRLIRTTDLVNGRLADTASGIFVPEEAVNDADRLAAGDLLLSRSGTVGRAFLVPPDAEGMTFAGFLVRFRPRSDVVSRYLFYCTQSAEFQSSVQADAITSTIQNFNADRYNNLAIPLPSADEQRRIADYLDRETARIDTLIAEQQRLVELLRERRAAVIESAVTEVVRASRGQRLKHVVLETRQGWSPQCYPWPADGVSTWAVLKAGAANGGIFRAAENKELPYSESPRPNAVVQRGQLVVSRANTRELLGSAAVVTDDYPRLMLCDKLYGFMLDPERAEPRFVAAVLGTRRLRGLIELEASGSSPSMQNISQADILNLPMDLPNLDVQRQVMRHVDLQTRRIDTLMAETERFIELARERRSALITAAVTGQIDVRAIA